MRRCGSHCIMGVGVVLSCEVDTWDLEREETMIPRCVDGLVQLFLLFHTHTSFGGIKHHPCVGTDKLLQQLHILVMDNNIPIPTNRTGVSTDFSPSNASLACLLWGNASFMVPPVTCPHWVASIFLYVLFTLQIFPGFVFVAGQRLGDLSGALVWQRRRFAESVTRENDR